MPENEAFTCPRCGNTHETLEARYAGDEHLLALYKKKLPRMGWAGTLDCTEREYVLRASPWRRALAERAREAPLARQRRPGREASVSEPAAVA